MKIKLRTKADPIKQNELTKKNYCAINRHHFLKGCKDYKDLNKINSYNDNEYVITDIDDVFNSICKLGKRIYEKYPNEIISILTLQPINNDTRLLKLLYKWIEPNGFPYYIDESINAGVSCDTLLRFGRDSMLIYLFEEIHKLCAIINITKDEYRDDINILSNLLKNIKLNDILEFSIIYNDRTNSFQEEAVKYGKNLLKSLNDFSAVNYFNDDIKKINDALIYIVTTEIYYRDELDAFMCQPIFNEDNIVVLDSFNSLVGVAYHKLIAKITNINAEEIRCRNCKAWVPKKSDQHKFCDKKECQKARNRLNKSNVRIS